MFTLFVDKSFFDFVKNYELFGVQPLELNNDLSILLVECFIWRNLYIDSHAIKFSLFLLQESEQIFKFSSLLFSSKLGDSKLELNYQLKFTHVSLTNIKISLEHHVEQIVHVFEVVVLPFITFFELLPVIKFFVGCTLVLFSVFCKLFIFWEHVQLVTTNAVDIVV